MAFRKTSAPIAGKNCDDPALDYKDLDYLKKFLTPHGQIVSRRRSGFCAQCQKELKLQVKRARHLALLPFVG